MITHRAISPKLFVNFSLLILLASLLIALFLLGSVPPVDRDALTHHLYVPKLWLDHGGIYEIPHIPFSYYPMNLDLLYAIPLYFGNDIIPKYIHAFFALLTGGLIYHHLRKRLGTPYDLLGALFFLSVPIIVKLAITVYVDLGVVFFTTASLLLLLQWAEQGFKKRFLIFAGLCCGLAAGTKYNGIVAIVVLTLLAPLIYQRYTNPHNSVKALLWGFVFVITSLIACSPWLIRNYTWTGNPIYPLHNSFFQSMTTVDSQQLSVTTETTDKTPQQESNKGGSAFIARKTLYNESWWQAIMLPIRFFYEGQDDNPKYFDGKLTPFLLLLPALAFLLRPTDVRQHREQNFLLTFAVLYFVFTFFQDAIRIRYIVPSVPPLVILSMYSLHGLFSQLNASTISNFFRNTLFFLIMCIPVIMLWYNGQYIVAQFGAIQPLPYLRGDVSREEYIAAFRPEYAAIQYANSTLPINARVLCIFLGYRGYYMDFHPFFEQPYSNGFLRNFLLADQQEHTILDAMQQQGITHVLMRDDLTTSWWESLNKKGKSRILPLFNNATDPLFKRNGYTFFKIDGEK